MPTQATALSAVMPPQQELPTTAMLTSGEEDTAIRCLGVSLQDGCRCRHFIAFLSLSLVSICLLVFMNAANAFLLSTRYNVPTDQLGSRTSELGVADELWSIATLGMWGVASDKIGRARVVVLGLVQISAALFLFPLGTAVYPTLLLFRLLFAQGAAAVTSMLTACLADYVALQSMGRASGLMGLCSGLGALIAVFVLIRLPERICVANTYFLVAGLCLAAALLLGFGLRSRSSVDSQDDNPLHLMRRGLAIAATNPTIAYAYAAGFLARSGSVVISAFVSLWVTRYYLELEDQSGDDVCSLNASVTADILVTACAESFLDPDKALCRQAFTRSSILGGVVQTAALVAAPFVGFGIERADKVLATALAAGLGFVAYSSVGLVSDPTEGAGILVVACLLGLAQISSIITSQALVASQAPANLHGTVAGCFSLVGGVGVMVTTGVGGVLFDRWTPVAPFLISALISAAVAAAGLRLFSRQRRRDDLIRKSIDAPLEEASRL